MYWMISVVVLIGLGALWLWQNPRARRQHTPPHMDSKPPLNQAERELLRRLQAVFPEHLLLPQLPLDSLLQWQDPAQAKPLGELPHLRCDMVICTAQGDIVAIVEFLPLRQPEHAEQRRAFLAAAGLRITPWSLDTPPSDAELKQLVQGIPPKPPTKTRQQHHDELQASLY